MEQQPPNLQRPPVFNPYGSHSNFKPETDTELVASLATPGQQSSIKKIETVNSQGQRVIAEVPTKYNELFTTDSRLGNLNPVEKYLVKQYKGMCLILSEISEYGKLDLSPAQKYFSEYSGIHENVSVSTEGFLINSMRSQIQKTITSDGRVALPEPPPEKKRFGIFGRK